MARPRATGADIYVANQAFAAVVDGEQVWVSKGDRAEKGAAILKGREQFFDADTDDNIRFKKRPTIEKATAAPGEQRGA
jgi:hypothetical protein